MDESVRLQPKPKTAADYKSAAVQLLAEMNRLDELMDKSHAESERLKVETQVIKAETEIIKARTEATLTRLQEQVDNLTRAA